MPEPGMGNAPERDGYGGSRQGPESQDARGGGNFAGIGGNRDRDGSNGPRSKLGAGGLRLPPEYADFILADGRRLEDVLGKSFFKGFGKDGRNGKGGAHARMLAERRAQAKRLNETRSILTGAQGVAGAANTARKTLTGR